MKLEEGMYFRRIGIKKINTLEKFTDDEYKINGFYVRLKEIKKASHNIIDLIEVGDYVNGKKIKYINFKDNEKIVKFANIEGCYYTKEEIKTIVTKECFESMQYEVE